MNEMPYTDSKGRTYGYGEFFPVEISPFAYNETVAADYFPLSREGAVKAGYVWRDREVSNYQLTKEAKDLPDHIRDIREDILNEIIGCARCGHAYRIIKKELDFLRRQG